MPITRRQFLKRSTALALAGASAPLWLEAQSCADKGTLGPFQPTWESLAAYRCPDWFRDAKFGIWAHWSAQCVPEQGDWYARLMYMPSEADYKYHCEHYGHPSKFGFKDIDHIWRAQNWDPHHLIELYKAAGAKYMVSLANHHDNFDTFDSTYQPWNSVRIGPKKDIIGTWAKAARGAGLHFGVSVHASHAWNWFEVAQGADTSGPYTGVPYDGKLTKADGKGLWWEGLDPQDLYAQNHTPGNGLAWEWKPGQADVPDQAYIEKYYNRITELIDKYHPDLVCFDDTVMPFNDISDVGLRLTAHLYNESIRRHGRLEAVVNTKGLTSDDQRRCLVGDIERGGNSKIATLPWQTESCIGQWHYARWLYDRHAYKTPETVVHMLVDTVSKNGNLLLSIPVRGDGTIDPDEVAFLQGMAAWIAVNGEAIYGTRPWTVFGEGPTKPRAGGFSEGRPIVYTPHDFRFTTKRNTLYAFAMAWPDRGSVAIQTLAAGAPGIAGDIKQVRLLGAEDNLPFERTSQGLVVVFPNRKPCEHAYGLEISGLDLAASKPVSGSS
ncbi:MAG TPA: alpha-L-fucosidase [Capsulimonadaceae bacterium]|nr:alpha-L-fucosidase [Capsulimonadaceae bacterium]